MQAGASAFVVPFVTTGLRAGSPNEKLNHASFGAAGRATLYHNLGIDVKSATVPDLGGRPRYLVDQEFEPMRELV